MLGARPTWEPAPSGQQSRPRKVQPSALYLRGGRGQVRMRISIACRAGKPSPPDVQGGEVEINLDEARGPVKEWILQEPVQREVRRRFARFLRTFQNEDGDYVYRSRVREMARSELWVGAVVGRGARTASSGRWPAGSGGGRVRRCGWQRKRAGW